MKLLDATTKIFENWGSLSTNPDVWSVLRTPVDATWGKWGNNTLDIIQTKLGLLGSR